MKAGLIAAGFALLIAAAPIAQAQSTLLAQNAPAACACWTTGQNSTCCALKSTLNECVECAVGKGNPRDGATGWCRKNLPLCRRR